VGITVAPSIFASVENDNMMSSQPANGKVALVTGASSGIGRQCANRLLGLGYKVYGASRHIQAAGDIYFQSLVMNVDEDESVRIGVEKIMALEKRIDIVVNCAGFGISGAVEDTSIEEAKAQFETNFFGVMRVCRQVLPAMRQQRVGLIVNISSLAGLTGIPFQGLYSASKFALEGLSESLRMEVAEFGIRVVLIEPGDFATGFTSQRQPTRASQTDTAYRQACDRAIARMAQGEKNGPLPERVAQLLERIVHTPSPRLRYKTGLFAQTLGVGLKRVLPYALYEKVMMKMYGL
jgi:NAD(P)-dependent dehydrogenase (short-subunit alcohol dehydrogenase family)